MHEDTFFFSDDALKISFSSKIYCRLDLLLHQHISEFIIATKHAFLIISFNIFSLFLISFEKLTIVDINFEANTKFWPPSIPLLYDMGTFWQSSPIFFSLQHWEEKSKQISAWFCLNISCPWLPNFCFLFFFLKKSKVVSIGNILENWLKTGLQ